jgi:hypothetical protein
MRGKIQSKPEFQLKTCECLIIGKNFRLKEMGPDPKFYNLLAILGGNV